MTKDDIISMASKAGCKPVRNPAYWDDVQVFAAPDVLERFAKLVAAAEREACAVIAFNAKTYLEAAESIRARGQHDKLD
jgi:hypothetical protein